MTSTGFRAFFPTNPTNSLHPMMPNMRLMNGATPKLEQTMLGTQFSLPHLTQPQSQNDEDEVSTSNHGAGSSFSSESMNSFSAESMSQISTDHGNESGKIFSNIKIKIRNKISCP